MPTTNVDFDDWKTTEFATTEGFSTLMATTDYTVEYGSRPKPSCPFFMIYSDQLGFCICDEESNFIWDGYSCNCESEMVCTTKID